MNEKAAREESAAQVVASELLHLLQHARRRGLSVQESFAHFDVSKNGFIDIPVFIDGLARLGIGVVAAVAAPLMQIIGGVGSTFLTVYDFERFVNSVPDDNASVSVSVRPGDKAATTPSPTRSMSQSQSRASQAPKRTKGIQKGKSRASVGSGTALTTDSAVLSDASADVAGTSADRSGALQLPPLKQPSAESQTRSTQRTSSASELPSWALRRHRRALKELKRAQDQYVKKETAKAWKENIGGTSAALSSLPSQPPLSGSHDEYSSTGTDLFEDNSREFSGDSFSRNGSSGSINKLNARALTSPRKLQLNLMSISREIDAEMGATNPDLFLHIDGGLLMTYRILYGRLCSREDKPPFTPADNRSGPDDSGAPVSMSMSMSGEEQSEAARGPSRGAQDLHRKSFLQKRLKSLGAADPRQDREGGARMSSAFTLFVVPDLFSTLESLQTSLEPLLAKYPKARLILVGLPGLPHTHWPRGLVLSPELHTACIYKLFTFLMDKGQLSSSADDAVLLMGVGTGAYYLSRFIANRLLDIPGIFSVVRAAIFVSGFMKLSRMLKRVWQELNEALGTAKPHEMNNIVASLHFWDEFLARQGREGVLQSFWKSRRGMNNERLEGGQGFVGVLEILKGLMLCRETEEEGQDRRMQLLSTRLPLLIVHGTEDVFVDPRHAKVWVSDSLPVGRTVVESIEDCLRPGAIHVSWLRAGHELVQERSSYLLSVVSSLAKLCGIVPYTEVGLEEVEGRGGRMEDGRKEGAEDPYDLDLLLKQRKDMLRSDTSEVPFPVTEPREKEGADNGSEMESGVSLSVSQVPVPSSEHEKLAADTKDDEIGEQDAMERRMTELRKSEREKRAKLLAEKKKRLAQSDRRMELERLYEMQRLERQYRVEMKEREAMMREDERSMFAEEFVKECELAANTSKQAKRKARELFIARREEAIRRMEDHNARERTRRLNERYKQSEELARQIETDLLDFPGSKDGGYDIGDGKDVLKALAATQRLLKDLLSARQRLVDTLKRRQLLYQKCQVSRDKCDEVEREGRRLRRTLRVIDTNPVLRDVGTSDDEVEKMRRNLRFKENNLQELRDLLAQRQKELRLLDKCCGLLKIASDERTFLMYSHMERLNMVEREYTQAIRQTRHEKEFNMGRKDVLVHKANVSSKRVKALAEERVRIQHVEAEYVDTDVWVEGVLQRCKTKDLLDYLRMEHEREQEKLKGIEKEIEALRNKILDKSEKQQKMERDCYKVSQTGKIFRRSMSKIGSQLPADLAKELLSRQVTGRRNCYCLGDVANSCSSYFCKFLTYLGHVCGAGSSGEG